MKDKIVFAICTIILGLSIGFLILIILGIEISKTVGTYTPSLMMYIICGIIGIFVSAIFVKQWTHK